jgi:hypothetical protein
MYNWSYPDSGTEVLLSLFRHRYSFSYSNTYMQGSLSFSDTGTHYSSIIQIIVKRFFSYSDTCTKVTLFIQVLRFFVSYSETGTEIILILFPYMN